MAAKGASSVRSVYFPISRDGTTENTERTEYTEQVRLRNNFLRPAPVKSPTAFD